MGSEWSFSVRVTERNGQRRRKIHSDPIPPPEMEVRPQFGSLQLDKLAASPPGTTTRASAF